MKAQVISFQCVLTNSAGQHISWTYNRDVLTQTSQKGAPLPGLAEGLQNLKAGEKRKIFVPAAKAYGPHDPLLTAHRIIDRGQQFKIGDQMKARTLDGKLRVCRVTGVHGNHVLLDANHPLAGQDLIFDIVTMEAREATPEELDESAGPSSAFSSYH